MMVSLALGLKKFKVLILMHSSCISAIVLLSFAISKSIAAVYINYSYSTSSVVQSRLSSLSSSCCFVFFVNKVNFVANIE